MNPIYLDYNGSAPLDPRVAEAMLPVLLKGVGNASSSHLFGRNQTLAVNHAREQVAVMVGGHYSNTVFTAGATEANNLALLGLLNNGPESRTKILVSAVEHASVFETAKWIGEKKGSEVEIIPVTKDGFVDLDALEHLVDSDTLLVSVMAANSETGVLNPLNEIAEIVHAAGAVYHCDATQLAGRQPFDLVRVGADLVSVSSHKICGPTGVGALVGTHQVLRMLHPIIHGGGHEKGLRSGSLNTAGIVGFGVAAQIAAEERLSESVRIAGMRDQLVAELKSQVSGVHENGDTTKRLSNTANIQFKGADAEAVLVNMNTVAVSTGSACSTGAVEPSRILLAMGISRGAAYESLRFSLGRFTTYDEIKLAVERTVTAVECVRRMTNREAV